MAAIAINPYFETLASKYWFDEVGEGDLKMRILKGSAYVDTPSSEGAMLITQPPPAWVDMIIETAQQGDPIIWFEPKSFRVRNDEGITLRDLVYYAVHVSKKLGQNQYITRIDFKGRDGNEK